MVSPTRVTRAGLPGHFKNFVTRGFRFAVVTGFWLLIPALIGPSCDSPRRDNPADPKSELYNPGKDSSPPRLTLWLTPDKVFGSGVFSLQGTADDNRSVLKVEGRFRGGEFSEAAGRETWVWQLDTSNHNNGRHVLEFRATDTGGNTTRETIPIQIDKAQPVAVLSGLPSPLTNSRGAAISVGGTDITEYQFKIDQTYYSNARPVSQPIEFTDYFLDGQHTIRVRGKNSLGTWQTDKAATEFTWIVDTQPPQAVLTPAEPDPGEPHRLEYTVGGTGVTSYYFSLNGTAFSGPHSLDEPLVLDASTDDLTTLLVRGVDGAGNIQTSGEASPAPAEAPRVIAARTLDIDRDGYIDHYQLIFHQPVDDSTFPGYNPAGSPGNRLHDVTPNWQVAGHVNIRLDTRGALPPNGPGDTHDNDNIIYLAFEETPPVFNTHTAPDIITSGAGLRGVTGQAINEITSDDLTEADGVPPAIARLEARTDTNLVIVKFHEPVFGNSGGSGLLPLTAFQWQNNSPGGATTLNAFDGQAGSNDGSDAVLRLLLDTNPVSAEGDSVLPEDGLKILAGHVFDAAGNSADHTIYLSWGVSQLTLGMEFACAITPSEGPRCWGRGSNGQLGNESTAGIGGSGGSLPVPDVPVLSAAEISSGIRVSSITAGYKHACAILSDGNLRCWGNSSHGQLGLGVSGTNIGDGTGEMPPGNVPVLSAAEISSGVSITQVTAGEYQTCALLSTGMVRCWGSALSAGTAGSYGGGGGMPPPDIELFSPAEITAGLRVEKLYSDFYGNCVLLNNNRVRCWGSNYGGILGIESTDAVQAADMPPANTEVLTPVERDNGLTITGLALNIDTSCALLSDGRVRCWGGSYGGDTVGSMPPADTAVVTPAEISGGLKVVQLDARDRQICALLSDGKVRCWSNGDSLPPANLSILTTAEESAGYFVERVESGEDSYRCVLISNGKVRCWGENDYGQAGIGSTSFVNLPTTDFADLGW